MPQLTIFHLTFPHGLHIGTGGVESVEDTRQTVPSDSLFAALLDTWWHLGRDINEILPAEGEPVFKVTSAFPFAGGVRFYPKPMDMRELFTPKTLQAESAGKRLKKIRYLSEGLLFKASQGTYLDEFLFPEDEYEDPIEGIAMQGGAFWCLSEEVKSLPKEWQLSKDKWWQLRRKTLLAFHTAPRVTVDRIRSATNLFQSERVVFNEGCGLWFGLTGQLDTFTELLDVLGDLGLGGERTVGYGHFIYQQQGAIPFSEPQSCAYLLSRWHPKADEVQLLKQKDTAYQVESVDGWLRTPENAAAQRRKRVWLVSEGSLIIGKPQGEAIDVKPEYDAISGETISHPVYRPGFSIALDWKRKVTHE